MKLETIQIPLGETEIFFNYREDSVGDKGVIQQIFKRKDYDIFNTFQGKTLLQYHNKNSKTNKSLIVDAGANIGASAVYFSNTYKNSFIFTIEPDKDNSQILSTNTSNIDCYNFQGAISYVDGELAMEDPGRSDWGFMTRKFSESENIPKSKIVKSISPHSILSNSVCLNTNPLIFKIDIEGGEEFLFSGNTNWMDKFPLIIIELHDWMLPFSGSSRNFIKSVAEYDFDFVYKGENIFLFNKRILAPKINKYE